MEKNLEERVSELEKLVKNLLQEKVVAVYKGLKVNDVFQLAGINWKILEISDEGYHCHAVDNWKKLQFDPNRNHWEKASLRKTLGELANEIEQELGMKLVPFERNMLSLDGQTEYGTCEDRVSLLTVDEYRKYRSMFPNTEDYWWWLLTPWSTPCNYYKASVTVVAPLGCIFNNLCNDCNGVRPFCIFPSVIFES